MNKNVVQQRNMAFAVALILAILLGVTIYSSVKEQRAAAQRFSPMMYLSSECAWASATGKEMPSVNKEAIKACELARLARDGFLTEAGIKDYVLHAEGAENFIWPAGVDPLITKKHPR